MKKNIDLNINILILKLWIEIVVKKDDLMQVKGTEQIEWMQWNEMKWNEMK